MYFWRSQRYQFLLTSKKHHVPKHGFIKSMTRHKQPWILIIEGNIFIHFNVTPFLCLQFRAAQVCSWKPFFQRTDTLFVCSNWFMYHEIMIFQMHALTDPCEFFPRTNITPLTLSTDCKSHAVLKCECAFFRWEKKSRNSCSFLPGEARWSIRSKRRTKTWFDQNASRKR